LPPDDRQPHSLWRGREGLGPEPRGGGGGAADRAPAVAGRPRPTVPWPDRQPGRPAPGARLSGERRLLRPAGAPGASDARAPEAPAGHGPPQAGARAGAARRRAAPRAPLLAAGLRRAG